MPSKDKILLQTHVGKTTFRQLQALAKASGHTRSGYLRHLVEMHVRAINPKLLKALNKTLPTILLKEQP